MPGDRRISLPRLAFAAAACLILAATAAEAAPRAVFGELFSTDN